MSIDAVGFIRSRRVVEVLSRLLTLRRHTCYDHGYYFIASLIDDHLHHYKEVLSAVAP